MFHSFSVRVHVCSIRFEIESFQLLQTFRSDLQCLHSSSCQCKFDQLPKKVHAALGGGEGVWWRLSMAWLRGGGGEF